ncbi:MAG: metallophosphoesterase [Candidatus Thorarchaeota archaeon]|nr:metallophosphoesterase [Candidatus Thorarchaeota archaeon]
MKLILEDRAVIVKGSSHTSMILSDLHIGYSVELSITTGVEFPFQHEFMLSRIETLIDKYDVETVFVAGDLKHTIGVDHNYNWSAIPELTERLSQRVRLVLVPGNHDGDIQCLLPRRVTLEDVRGCITKIDGVSLGIMHGHAWPAGDLMDCDLIIMGHCHPSIRRQRTVSVSGRRVTRNAGTIPVVLKIRVDRDCVRRCAGMTVGDSKAPLECVVMPAFNSLISGVGVDREDFVLAGPMFGNGCGRCASLMEAEVYSTAGVFLNTVQALRRDESARSTSRAIRGLE